MSAFEMYCHTYSAKAAKGISGLYTETLIAQIDGTSFELQTLNIFVLP